MYLLLFAYKKHFTILKLSLRECLNQLKLDRRLEINIATYLQMAKLSQNCKLNFFAI